jgi:ATP-dependent Clp protease protease subunit
MIRTIVEESQRNIAIMDVFSKLIQERIIFIDSTIDSELANGVIAQMLYLDSLSHEEPISVYINSDGGSVYDGLAIYDTSEIIKCPIKTFCVGLAASMGAILMLMGKERYATKRSRLMLHQVSGGVIGTAEEIRITNEETQKVEKTLYDIIESKTKLTKVNKLLKNDTWFSAEEALKVGLITDIL